LKYSATPPCDLVGKLGVLAVAALGFVSAASITHRSRVREQNFGMRRGNVIGTMTTSVRPFTPHP